MGVIHVHNPRQLFKYYNPYELQSIWKDRIKQKYDIVISLSLGVLTDQIVGEAKNKGTTIKFNRLSFCSFSQQADNLKENKRKKKSIRKIQNC